jgi:hypothetical protein
MQLKYFKHFCLEFQHLYLLHISLELLPLDFTTVVNILHLFQG